MESGFSSAGTPKYDISFAFWKPICACENPLFFITDQKRDFVRRFVM